MLKVLTKRQMIPLAVAALLAGCAGIQASLSESSQLVAQGDTGRPVAMVSPTQIDQARAAIVRIPVKGRAAGTGYSPELFLPKGKWPSTGQRCTVRDQIVRRDAHDLVPDPDRPCHATQGRVLDPYSGVDIDLSQAQVDHIVARKDAYTTGASDESFQPSQRWTSAEQLRHAIGRDPDNLLLVSGRLNAQKGQSGVASWVPPNKAYRCSYAVRIVLLKDRYQLWATPAEHHELVRYLSTCPTVTR